LKHHARLFSKALVLATLVVTLAAGALAQTETILHTFTGGSDGGYPSGTLISDSSGNLYGTTGSGGSGAICSGCGTVFELVRGSNGTWTQNVLYSFGSLSGFVDGVFPEGRLAFDSKGNLYGTTNGGGSGFDGTVFELSPQSNGAWTETVLYNFTGGSAGGSPFNGVVFDSHGNLYGAVGGGANGFGLIFELVLGTNGTWTEKVLHNFTDNIGGVFPYGPLVFDQAGNLYGASPEGGTLDYGLVFELTPVANGKWTEKVLHVFPGGSAGSFPEGLALDAAGNLYGVASYIAYELSPTSGGVWKFKTLHTFVGGVDGASPQSALAFDRAGNLYGTTTNGGVHRGTVYELIPGANGAWSERILHLFAGDGVDGVFPGTAAVAIDSTGNLFGTTGSGGASKAGVVYEIVP
jgi:uncharacterized repeat protein (TIGR03803 family)